MKDEKKGRESENVHNDILELYGVTVAHPGNWVPEFLAVGGSVDLYRL